MMQTKLAISLGLSVICERIKFGWGILGGLQILDARTYERFVDLKPPFMRVRYSNISQHSTFYGNIRSITIFLMITVIAHVNPRNYSEISNLDVDIWKLCSLAELISI